MREGASGYTASDTMAAAMVYPGMRGVAVFGERTSTALGDKSPVVLQEGSRSVCFGLGGGLRDWGLLAA
jgi:hypothetical protein